VSTGILDQPASPVASPNEQGERILVANALAGLEARFVAERLATQAVPTLLYVTRDAQRSTALAALVRFFAPEVEVLTLPAWDCLPYDRVSPNATVVAERLATLHTLAQGPAKRAAAGPRLGQRLRAEAAAAGRRCAPATSSSRPRLGSTAMACSNTSSATATSASARWSSPATTRSGAG
jgi:transcription-repair coupling factor (superfamily II helicase)